jgi:tRNA(Ile)-lysidine synthase
MIGEIFNAKDYSLKPKATIQQTGKTGFNADAINQLKIDENKAVVLAPDTQDKKVLYMAVVEADNYKIVRPLIQFTKDELKQYNIDNNVKYYVDSSNEKDKYTRNRYRKYVLPFLREEEKNVHLKFLKYSESLIDACRFIDTVTQKEKEKVLVDGKINIDLFLELDGFIQKEILYLLLNDFYQDDLILVCEKHITLILNLINSKKSNATLNLPNNVIGKKNYNYFELIRDTDIITGYEMEFDDFVELPNNHMIERINDTVDNSNYVCRLNSEEVALPLIVRTRRIGDKMYVKGLNGSKKIKDIFIDKKLSLQNRDSWPIVLDSKGNIVWIPGIKKSKFDKKKTEVYDIILKYS